MVRVGVIGVGSMGRTHVRTLSASVPGAELTAIADTVAGSAKGLAREVGVEATYADGLELIHDPNTDAVVIASPPDSHERLVLACLGVGKPVLCEKPLASTADAAWRVVEAELARGRQLVQVGFMRRFDPAYVDLRARLQRGDVGTPVLVYSTHRNATVPPGFGTELIIKDTVVHDVDIARWLLGAELIKVTVFTPRPSSRAPDGVRDPQLAVFETDSGALVQVEAFVHAGYGYDIRCEVVGESGTLTLAQPPSTHVRRGGHAGVEVPMGFQERFASAYVTELRTWVDSVARGTLAGASAWDGYAASTVCEAAWQSLTTGQPATVELQRRPDLYRRAPTDAH
jgi:myo-inositol 2-dehydrogenase / D-chiro-inositol 1-dehydrogenase